MATTKEVLVIILDVGKTTTQRNDTSKLPFFERAKICTEKILQRKIFSKPKDEIGLILMGTDSTHNNLNSTLGGYENISEAFDVATTNWQMLKILDKEISQNKSDADWLDAIIVAMDFMKTQTTGKKFSSRKICLMTPFSTGVDDERSDEIINALNEMKIELIAITDNIEYVTRENRNNNEDSDNEDAIFSQAIPKTQEQITSESLIIKMTKSVNNSALTDFDLALFQLIYFEKKTQRSAPWNCKLEIGSRLRINVTAYIHVKDTSSMSSWKTYGPNGVCKTQTKYYVDEVELKSDEIEKLIRGYMYGKTPVPFDKSLGLSFDSGEKCLICIGFTNANLMRDEHFTGTGIWTVVPQNGCTVSEKMFAAMVTTMRQSNLAMIARYVYRSGLKAKMMALFPQKLSESGRDTFRDSTSLSMMEIFFADNHNYMEFPSLKTRKNEPTEEQYNAIDELIDSMDLMNAYDHESGSNEAFACKKILNPTLQYTYRTIAHRAMYPTLPIPQPEQDLLDLLDVPEKIKKNAEKPMAKVKAAFPLETIAKATKADLYKKMRQISSIPGTSAGIDSAIDSTAVDNDTAVVEIGTITPAEDLMELLRRGERFAPLCAQIQNVISDLIFNSIAVQDEKLLKAIMVFRLQAIELGPYRYNEWITEFKDILLNRNKIQIWQKFIVAERLGLILTSESETSLVTDEEGRAFYTVGVPDSVGGDNSGAAAAEDDDIENLLDEM